MKVISNREKGITIGIDLGDKKHAVCVLDHEGKIIDERSMVNSREASVSYTHLTLPTIYSV